MLEGSWLYREAIWEEMESSGLMTGGHHMTYYLGKMDWWPEDCWLILCSPSALEQRQLTWISLVNIQLQKWKEMWRSDNRISDFELKCPLSGKINAANRIITCFQVIKDCWTCRVSGYPSSTACLCLPHAPIYRLLSFPLALRPDLDLITQAF